MKVKKILFCMLLIIGSCGVFYRVAEAKTVEEVKFSQYIQSGRTYNLTKFLKNAEKNSLSLNAIPKKNKVKWKTSSSRIKVKNGTLRARSNGTYKIYTVKGDKKYTIQITAVSSELSKIPQKEVERIEIKETNVGKKTITEKKMIHDICSQFNNVKWKFSDTHSNRQKFGSTYSVIFYLESGSKRSYIVRKTMLQSKGYYKSVPELNIFDYVDGLYKNMR